MFKDWSYEEATKAVDAIKQIGLGEIWLNKGEYPWHLATDVKTGGSHRLDISTSVWFSGHDPDTDLKFRWSFDIEPREANGKGVYMIDIQSCKRVLGKLRCIPRTAFQAYLLDCAEKVEKHAKELSSYAGEEFNTANLLREAAQEA